MNETIFNGSSNTLKQLWVRDGFHNPECAVVDPVRDHVYLANMASDGGVTAVGQGHISRLGLDGTLLERKWIDGLRNPMGMILVDNLLHVVDLDRIRIFDTSDGRQLAEHIANGATYLDGVTIDEATGTIFISDFMANAVWRFSGGVLV